MSDTTETMPCGGKQFESFSYFDLSKNGVEELHYTCVRCGMVYAEKPEVCEAFFVLRKIWKGDPINDFSEGVYQETWYGFSKWIDGQRIEGMTYGEARKIKGIKIG